MSDLGKGADWPVRREVALGCRVLAYEGHHDIIWGHASARANADRFWMKCAELGLEEVSPEDVILLDLDGNVLQGNRPRHVEFPIHAEIYRSRPDVGAVVHTHPLHATVFASLEQPLRPVTHEGTFFVPPDISRFHETSDLILTREQGEAIARALGEGNALLMRNHGLVVAAPSTQEACFGAVVLERAAKAQLLAMSAGPFSWTEDTEALLKREHIYHSRAIAAAWEYYRRKLEPPEWGGAR